MLKTEDQYIPPEEYLRLEETSERKSEYLRGEIFAMTGASFRHNVIMVNLVSELDSSLEGSDCTVFSADLKVRAEKNMHFVYPDVGVVCGDIEFEKDRDDTIANPVAIFEILSKSTMDYDRGSKFKSYRNMESMRDYVLVDQYACGVEHFFKATDGRWVLEEFYGMDEVLHIRSLNVDLPLRRIYKRLKMEGSSLPEQEQRI